MLRRKEQVCDRLDSFFFKSNLDMFSFTASLNIQRKPRIGTRFGSILSFLIVLGTIYFMIIFFLEIMSLRKPNIFITEESYIKNPKIEMNSKNFIFGIGLISELDEGNQERDSLDIRELNISISIHEETLHKNAATMKTRMTLKKTLWKLISCIQKNLPFTSPSLSYRKISLTDSLCIVDGIDISLIGQLGDSIYRYIDIQIE